MLRGIDIEVSLSLGLENNQVTQTPWFDQEGVLKRAMGFVEGKSFNIKTGYRKYRNN